MGVRGSGDGEVGAGAAAQGGSCGSARWKTQLLQHPPVPAQPGMLSTPGGEWSTATSREICRALSWHYLGKGVPQNLFPYSSVLVLGLVGLAQLFRGGDGPSRGWGRNRFLLRGCLGWKNWETGGSHAAGTWNRCLAPPPVLLPLLGKTSWGGNGAGARCPRLAGCWSRRPQRTHTDWEHPAARGFWDPGASPACALSLSILREWPGRPHERYPSRGHLPGSIALRGNGGCILKPPELRWWLRCV